MKAQRPRSHSIDLDDDDAKKYLKLPQIKEEEETDMDEDYKEEPLKEITSSTETVSTASMNLSSTRESITTPINPPKTELWGGWDHDPSS